MAYITQAQWAIHTYHDPSLISFQAHTQQLTPRMLQGGEILPAHVYHNEKK
jgi:hypothetical protein